MVQSRDLFLVDFFDILFQRHRHGRRAGFRSVDIQREPGFLDGFGGGGAKCRETRFVLLELGEVLEQRSDSGRAEENEDIVIDIGKVAQVTANRAVNNGFGVIDLVLVEDLGNIFLVNVGAGIKEFIFLVLADDLDQVVERGFAVEDFAFAVLNVFLQVISGGFGYAEIFHRIRNGETHFLADAEEMVNRITAGKDHSGKIADVHALLAEFLCGNAFHMNELTEIDLEIVLLRQLRIRILIRFRFRLGDQYTLYFKICILRCCQELLRLGLE